MLSEMPAIIKRRTSSTPDVALAFPKTAGVSRDYARQRYDATLAKSLTAFLA
jgi:hypothetical protein